MVIKTNRSHAMQLQIVRGLLDKSAKASSKDGARSLNRQAVVIVRNMEKGFIVNLLS